MKKTLIIAGFAGLMATSAMAQNIGVSMALFDDNFLTVLHNGMVDQAAAMDGRKCSALLQRVDRGNIP